MASQPCLPCPARCQMTLASFSSSVSPVPHAAFAPASHLNSNFPRSISLCVLNSVSGELRRTFGDRRVLVSAVESEVAVPIPVEEGPNTPCDTCNSKGWLQCDFCKGQKTNVQVRANKFYRRCPSCRAVGVVICPRCKVFKCLTSPYGTDGSLEDS